jgi:hypothetical protein
MEPKTIAQVCRLQIGDRFYRANDSTKKMFTKVEVKPKRGKYIILKDGGLKDGDKKPHYFMPDTPVVFMRHTNS